MTLSAVLLYAGASGFGVTPTVAMLALSLGFAASCEGPVLVHRHRYLG